MVHWNAYGDWTTGESGHGTKKAFITSHMKCTKQQEVDLTEFFCVEYLDTSPEIQVNISAYLLFVFFYSLLVIIELLSYQS